MVWSARRALSETGFYLDPIARHLHTLEKHTAHKIGRGSGPGGGQRGATAGRLQTEPGRGSDSGQFVVMRLLKE